jgi:hypothetical protein
MSGVVESRHVTTEGIFRIRDSVMKSIQDNNCQSSKDQPQQQIQKLHKINLQEHKDTKQNDQNHISKFTIHKDITTYVSNSIFNLNSYTIIKVIHVYYIYGSHHWLI